MALVTPAAGTAVPSIRLIPNYESTVSCRDCAPVASCQIEFKWAGLSIREDDNNCGTATFEPRACDFRQLCPVVWCCPKQAARRGKIALLSGRKQLVAISVPPVELCRPR
jgi:hypothetical protein